MCLTARDGVVFGKGSFAAIRISSYKCAFETLLMSLSLILASSLRKEEFKV
jgi:hypothetical protein